MAKNDKDLKIGISTEYDGSGAQAALADAEKVKQANTAAAASAPQSGGSPAAPSPQGGGKVDTSGEESLAKARENTAEATGKATEASKELTAARTDGQKATTTAATVEKTLATERKATADATTTAADAEQKAANEATAAAQQKQQASAQNTEALSKEQQEIEALKAQMALEAKGRAGLIKELERLGKARARAAKAGDVQAFKQLEAQMTKTRQAFERMNQGLEISRLGMMGQMQVAMGAMGAIQSLGNEVKSGSVSLMGMANAVYALGAAIKAGMGPVGWILMAIQGLSMAWDYYSDKQEEAAEAERARIQANNEALARHLEQVQKLAALSRENMFASARAELEDIGAKFDKLTAQQEQVARRTEQREAAAEQRRRAAAQAVFEAEQARVELARTLGQITEADATARLRAAEDVLAAELAAVDEQEKHRTNAAAIEAKRRAEKEAAELEAAIAEKFAGTDSLLKLELPSAQEWEALQIKYTEGLTDAVENAAETRIRGELVKLRRLMESMGIAFEGGDEELLRWLDDLRAARAEADKMVEAARAEAESAGQKAELAKLELETKKQEAAAESAAREARRNQQEAAAQNQQLEQQWAEVQQQELAEQVKWLEATTANFVAGSKAAEKWARELEAVKLRQVQEELNGLATVYKVTGHYAARDSRTQEEIYAADRAALEARRTALEQLRQQPGLDAAMEKQINDKLAETRSQLAGLESAMAASAREAQQMLEGLRPLAQQAKQSNWSHALKRSEQAFLNMAKLAERQAKKGDTAGMERSIAAMQRYAAQQERLTGHTGRAVKHAQEVERNLRRVSGSMEQEAQELTRSARAGRQDERTRRRRERAEQRAAAAQEREARELEKAAREAKSDTKKRKPRQQAQQIAELTRELNVANNALDRQHKEVLKLNEAIALLSRLAGEGADAAQQCAGAALAAAQVATSSLAGLKRELAELRRAVEKMRKGS